MVEQDYETILTANQRLASDEKLLPPCEKHPDQIVSYQCVDQNCMNIKVQNLYCHACKGQRHKHEDHVFISFQVEQYHRRWQGVRKRVNEVFLGLKALVQSYKDIVHLFDPLCTGGIGDAKIAFTLRDVSSRNTELQEYFKTEVLPNIEQCKISELDAKALKLNEFERYYEQIKQLQVPDIMNLWRFYQRLDVSMKEMLDKLTADRSIEAYLRIKLQKIANTQTLDILTLESFNPHEVCNKLVRDGCNKVEIELVVVSLLFLEQKKQNEAQSQANILQQQHFRDALALQEQASVLQQQKLQETFAQQEQANILQQEKLKQSFAQQEQQLQSTLAQMQAQFDELRDQLQGISEQVTKKPQLIIEEESKQEDPQNVQVVPVTTRQKFEGSSIVTGKLIERMNGYFGGSDFSLKLLYRASKDGATAKDFHRLCDNNAPTLIIVQPQSGDVLGGYTQELWQSDPQNKEDPKAWVFTTASASPSRFKGDRWAISCNPSKGPMFGFSDLVVFDSSKQGDNCYVHGGIDQFDYSESGRLLNAQGRTWFTAKEVEVYQVEYY